MNCKQSPKAFWRLASSPWSERFGLLPGGAFQLQTAIKMYLLTPSTRKSTSPALVLYTGVSHKYPAVLWQWQVCKCVPWSQRWWAQSTPGGLCWNTASNYLRTVIYLVPLRRENELALLVYSAGEFEICFEKWLFLKMKMLTVFIG